MTGPEFDPDCKRCPRLAHFLSEVYQRFPLYHCAPVPPFGDPGARLLVVGLAPGMHGANASGRPFTGDYAGILLYQTLHRYGFSNLSEVSGRGDGLQLYDCRITNAVKCLPPGNKPVGSEVAACNVFLAVELKNLPAQSVILSLGGIAHKAVIRALRLKLASYPFRHGAAYDLPDGQRLMASYHCSRYNTQTKRLTGSMFDEVVRRAHNYLND